MNRNYYIGGIILLAMALGYFGYRHFSQNISFQKDEQVVSTDKSTTTTNLIENTTKVKYSTTTPYYTLSYNTPAENSMVTDLIKKSTQDWFAETGVDKIHSKKEAEKIGITTDRPSCYEYSVDYFKSTTVEYTSYITQIYSYTCGAHGSSYNVVYNIGQDGKLIESLSALYKDEIYAYLSDYSRKNLPAVLKENEINVADIQEMFDEGTKPNKENFSTFYFKNDKLVIIFGQYQIGPYVIGIHELEVPLSNIIQYKK